MPHDKNDKTIVVDPDLIKETVMPPYEYQKPQNGFGSAGHEESSFKCKDEKTSKSKNKN